MDYGYYNYGYSAMPSISPVFGIVWLGVMVLFIVCMWKLFTKAMEPGWASIVPFYNTFVLFKISWGSGWKMFLLLIPLVNIVIMIMTYVKLAKAFNKSGVYALGMIFLPVIFFPLLAFGSAEYEGPWY